MIATNTVCARELIDNVRRNGWLLHAWTMPPAAYLSLSLADRAQMGNHLAVFMAAAPAALPRVEVLAETVLPGYPARDAGPDRAVRLVTAWLEAPAAGAIETGGNWARRF